MPSSSTLEKPSARPVRSDGLDYVFRPRSVAVLGVTNTPGTVPHDIFTNLLSGHFNGAVYPVAPRKRHIAGVRAYDYVLEIPDPVDMAVLVFPGRVCELALEQCGQKGVKAAIIISAGFREVGEVGAKREEEIKRIARQYGMRLIGPNCLGAINTEPDICLNASFARAMPDRGNIAFLSQSGALCTAVLDYAQGKHIGFSKFVSLGNKADVTEVEMLEYLADDPQTSVILMYLESIRDGRRMVEIAHRITGGANHKPILAIKGGRTAAGAAAAQSHTGALASSDVVCDAVFRQAGIIRAKSIEEMFNTAQLLANQPLPRGNHIAIVTNAGGPGVMATDAAIERGLELAKFSAETRAELKKALPPTANLNNPVDVIGDARDDRYAAAMEAVFNDEAVEEVLVILTPQSMTNITAIASKICEIQTRFAQTGKPLVCSFMGAKDVAPGIDILQRHGIPHYVLPEWACDAMEDAVRYSNWLTREQSQICEFSVERKRAAAVFDKAPPGYLSEPQALEVLSAYGFPIPEYRIARTAEAAVSAANEIGYPVVLRVLSPKIIHKSEVKGVMLNLASASDVRSAWSAMMDRLSALVSPGDIEGAIVRRMIPAGKEVILGVNRDATFGHVVMLGLGGIYVEAFKDITFRVVPVHESDTVGMLEELRTANVLKGLRGEKPSDLAAIRETVARLSQMAVEWPRIAELDINPLIVHPAGEGCAIADVRIRVD